jgi:hypothetical protein
LKERSVDDGYFNNLDNGILNKFEKKIIKIEKKIDVLLNL